MGKGKNVFYRSKNIMSRFLLMSVIMAFVMIFIFICPCVMHTKAATYNSSQKRVLFISSYSYAWEAVPEQIDGIRETLGDEVILDYQFMDTKNQSSDASREIFYEHMKQFLSEVPEYDALIVGDDDAFNFAVENKDTLFKDIPIVFEGVNNISGALKAAESRQVTGVTESLSFKNTIELAQKIYPDATRIVAVLDNTITGQGAREEYYSYEKDYRRLKFDEINTSELGHDELVKELGKLDDDTILLYVICSEDKDGNSYIGSQGVRLISESASIPAFSIVPIGVGQGVLGGEMVSQKGMGKVAAEIVLRVFSGEDIGDIGVFMESPREYRFDENVMKKYNIQRGMLPGDAIIINHVPGFLEKYRVLLSIFGVITGILIVGVVYLVITNVNKSIDNKKLSMTSAEYENMANHDALTGLPNRMAFKAGLERRIDNDEKFSVFLFDIDKFKSINDTYGHNNGDFVLKEVARRAQLIKDNRFQAFRLGGDEFTVIVDCSDYETVRYYADNVMKIFEEKFIFDDKEIKINTSLGIAVISTHVNDLDSVVNAADTAMYKVKKHGGNHYIFSEEYN